MLRFPSQHQSHQPSHPQHLHHLKHLRHHHLHHLHLLRHHPHNLSLLRHHPHNLHHPNQPLPLPPLLLLPLRWFYDISPPNLGNIIDLFQSERVRALHLLQRRGRGGAVERPSRWWGRIWRSSPCLHPPSLVRLLLKRVLFFGAKYP